MLSLPPATNASRSTTPAGPRHRPPPADVGRFTLADLKAQAPQRDDGTFLVDVPTLRFSASDPAARSVIEGQSVETTAQLCRNPSDPSLTTLSRSLTHCCSADARHFAIPVRFQGTHPSLPYGAWVTVTGTVAYHHDPAGYHAVLSASHISLTIPPIHPLIR